MLESALRARMPQASSCPDSGWNSSRLFRMVSRISSSRRDFRIFSLIERTGKGELVLQVSCQPCLQLAHVHEARMHAACLRVTSNRRLSFAMRAADDAEAHLVVESVM